MRDPSPIPRPQSVPACLVALVLMVVMSVPACATFKVENLEPGTQVPPRSDAVLIFGSQRVLDASGTVLFPGRQAFRPRPVLHLFGIFPSDKRTRPIALYSLFVHDDGTYAAWVPPGDYALCAFWPGKHGDIHARFVAAIRLPAAAAPVYTGELVFEVKRTDSLSWRLLFDVIDVTDVTVIDVTAIDESREEVQRKVERRSGALPPAQPVTIVWCTDGVPPGPDPSNARTLQRLDSGCGSAAAEPLEEQ